jgi:hypothetical protein
MKEEKVNEIMQKVIETWVNRIDIKDIDISKVAAVRLSLLGSPHEDGFMRVESLENRKTYLVPFEYIILNGLNGKDLEKFPVERRTKENE